MGFRIYYLDHGKTLRRRMNKTGSTKNTLEVYLKGKTIFSSRGKWLTPLMELDGFLQTCRCNPTELTVQDKIVGQAAALLLKRLRIGYVKAHIMSRPAKETLERNMISHGFDLLVERIDCRTEEMFLHETDAGKVYRFVKAKMSGGVQKSPGKQGNNKY